MQLNSKQIIQMDKLSEKQATDFGNYLLSKERNESVSELNKENVTHADYENWKQTLK